MWACTARLPALALLALVTRAVAEETGAVEGRVVDAISGEPVAAVILLIDPPARTVISDDDGRFSAAGLPVGTTLISWHRVGYLSGRTGPIDIASGTVVRLDIRIERDPVVESIRVSPHPEVTRPHPTAPPASLDREQILRMPGTLGDPARALTALPGVSGTNDFKAELRIRGGEPEDTLYRLDGVAIDSPYHFPWARGSTAALSPAAFDEIFVRSTGMRPELGDTVSGVVELRPSERGSEGRFLDASFGTLLSSVTGGGSVDPSGTWVAAARYSNLALYRSLYSVENVSVPGFGDLFLRTRLPAGERIDLLAGGFGLINTLSTRDEKEERSNDLRARSDAMYLGFDLRGDGWTPPADGTVSTPGATLHGARLSGRLSMMRSRQRVDTTEGDHIQASSRSVTFSLEGAGGAPIPHSRRSHRRESTPASRPEWGGLFWAAGMHVSSLAGMIAGEIQTTGPLPTLDESQTRFGSWGTIGFSPAPGWVLEAGGRGDHDSRLGSAPFQPRLAAEFRWASDWRLRLGAARYAQFPRFAQEYLTLDERLRVTRADEVSVTVDGPLPGGLQGQATAYFRRLRDVSAETINRLPDLPEPMGRFQRGRNQGVELVLNNTRGRFRWRAAGGLMSARAVRDGIGTPRNGDQPYKVDLSGVWFLGDHWEILGRFQASSGLPYSSYEPAGNGKRFLGPLNGRRLPAYARLDLRLAWESTWRTARVRAFVEADNVLDRMNSRGRDMRWDPREERYYFRDEQAMPLVPGLGLEISWGG